MAGERAWHESNNCIMALNSGAGRTLDPPALFTRRLWWGCVCGLALLGIAIYANAVDAAFHFDDVWNIIDNPAIRIDRISVESLLGVLEDAVYPSRPVASLSFALNYYLGGLEPRGFHLFNIAVHIGASLGLAVFVRLLLTSRAFKDVYGTRGIRIAVFASFLFLCHPVHVQAVTYVVQRMASMAAMFGIWSAAMALVAVRVDGIRRAAAAAAAVLLFALALGSKETAMAFALFGLLGWFVVSRRRSNNVARLLVIVGAFAAGAASVGLVNGFGPTLRMIRLIFAADQRLPFLTMPRGVVLEWSLFLLPLPSRLSLEHHVPMSEGLLTPLSTLFAWSVLIGVVGLAAWLGRHRPLVGLCLLWGTVPLVVEGLVVRHEPVMEHRLYLPALGLCVLAGLAVDRCVRAAPRLALAGFLVLVALCSAAVVERNEVWSTPLSLARDAAYKAPGKVRANANLVIELGLEERREEATAVYYERVRDLPAGRPRELRDKANAALHAQVYEDAVVYLRDLLGQEPTACGQPRIQLAHALYRLERWPEAIDELHAFDKCNALLPGEIERGNELRDTMAAILRARAAGNPSDIQGRLNLAAMLMSLDRPDEAARELESILTLAPDNPVAVSNLGYCHWELGNAERAVEFHERAIRLAPRMAGAHYGLGLALAALGQDERARASFETFLRYAAPSDIFRPHAEAHIRRLGSRRTSEAP